MMTQEKKNSRAFPPVIKKNFIYRAIWNNVNRHDMGAVFLFIGGVGNGKSTAALRWLSDLDPKFSTERVAFSVKESLALIKNGDSNGKLKPGSCILFDEIAGSEQGADSRNSLTETNKLLSYFVTISRSQRLIIIYCCPLLSQIDKRVRSIGVMGVCNFKRKVDFERKATMPDFYWAYTSSLTGGSYTPRATVKRFGEMKRLGEISIGLPKTLELVKEYKEKKDQFFYNNVARWNERLEEKEKGRAYNLAEMCKQINVDPGKYKDDKGKYSEGLIQLYFNVGLRIAERVRKVVENTTPASIIALNRFESSGKKLVST